MEAEAGRKEAVKVNKFHELLMDNQACLAKLGSEQPTMEDFQKCSVKELKAFIHVQQFKSVDGPSKDDEWEKFPNKGKVEDAKAGQKNLIKMAFDRWGKPIILESPEQASVAPAAALPNTRHTDATVLSVQAQDTPFSTEEKASSFLQDKSWVFQVSKALNPHSHAKEVEIDADALARADVLQEKLQP
jgi:hypothetical protein